MHNAKKQLLNNLRHNTYCRIGVSKLSGVGVIAIKDIPANVDPFVTVYKLDTQSIGLSSSEVESLDPGVSTLIKDFFMKDENDLYPVFYNGLNAMDIAYYLNHQDNGSENVSMVLNSLFENSPFEKNPREKNSLFEKNPRGKNSKQDINEYYTFKTIKPIKAGEELTINYYQHSKNLNDTQKIKKQFNLES